MIDYLLSPLARNLIVANQIFAQAFVHENNFLGRFRSWALTHNLLRRGPGEDDIGGVFGDHVDGANDEHPWYSRERCAGSRRQVGERRVPCLGPCVARWDKVAHEHVHLAEDVAHFDSCTARPGGPVPAS